MTNEERDKAIRILQWLHDNEFLFRSTEEDVKFATKLVIQELEQESKTAYWVYWYTNGFGRKIYKCSKCDWDGDATGYNFCPNCGRKMFKTGHWLFYGRLLKCSNCGYINDDILDECPNCKISMVD